MSTGTVSGAPPPSTTLPGPEALVMLDKIRLIYEQCTQEDIQCIGLYLGRAEWKTALPLLTTVSCVSKPPTIHSIPVYQVANVHSHWNAVAIANIKKP